MFQGGAKGGHEACTGNGVRPAAAHPRPCSCLRRSSPHFPVLSSCPAGRARCSGARSVGTSCLSGSTAGSGTPPCRSTVRQAAVHTRAAAALPAEYEIEYNPSSPPLFTTLWHAGTALPCKCTRSPQPTTAPPACVLRLPCLAAASYKYRRDYARMMHGPWVAKRLEPLPEADAERGSWGGPILAGGWQVGGGKWRRDGKRGAMSGGERSCLVCRRMPLQLHAFMGSLRRSQEATDPRQRAVPVSSPLLLL